MADIRPIDSLEELLKWENRHDIGEEYQVELINYIKKDGQEVLLCHDMKGGYLQEETNEGQVFEKGTNPYIFLNWWQIDIFNYFSHHFVTIPPFEYTRLAHQHGVLSMGTFITEWIDGAKICKQILENEEMVTKVVDGLVNVARYYGFDGWLINIENEIEPLKIPLLVQFCSLLTSKMREMNANSRVIWYDSVLHSGKLKWQNALNDKNCDFYNACDGIYLNYNWTDAHLFKSSDFGDISNIFVGIDVWARGCVGEFDCYKSFRTLQFLRFSVALFAPGWICEKFQHENQIKMGIDFWTKLSPFIKQRKLSSLEFSTDFGTGLTEIDGNKKLFKLSNMNIQPQCLDKHCYQNIGGGLKLIGSNQRFRLFSFDSLPFEQLEVYIKSDHPVKLIINSDIEATKQGNNFRISAGKLEKLEILTLDHEVTTIDEFRIKHNP